MAIADEQTIQPQADVKVNSKSDEPSDAVVEKPSKPAEKPSVKPKLARQDTIESFLSNHDEDPRQTRPVHRVPGGPRRYSPSPVRTYNRGPPPPALVTPIITSSIQLLKNIHYDGTAYLPYPDRSSIYLATFPFTDRDVKKWSWLFGHGAEDVWLAEGPTHQHANDAECEEEWADVRGRGARPVRNRRRDYSPYFHNFNSDLSTVDIPTVYLSRALDTTVVAEDVEEHVIYVIVVQNRARPHGGSKLLVAESRKAAGMLIFYEALTGNSVVFVGATTTTFLRKAKKFRRAEGMDEVRGLAEDGIVGVIC